MKEAIVKKDTSVNVIDSPIPKPGPGQVLIKVVVSGTNPKDWKRPSLSGQEANSGDDIAGTVEAVGENVVGFTKGDRVAAFHEMSTPHGSFAEYAVAPYYTTFPIPSSTSYEEAATIPLAAYTAVVALFQELQFPEPWSPLARAAGKEGTKRPLVVYGASTSVGAFAIKLAAAANIHPIVAVGSQRSAFIKPFLDESKGDTLVDYTASKTDEELIGAIQEAVKKGGAPEGTSWKILDAVSEDSTLKLLSKVLTASPKAAASTGSSKPRLTNVLYKSSIEGIDPSVEIFDSKVAQVHAEGEDNKLIGLIWAAGFSRGLREGWLTSHPYTVGKNGLESLSEGLTGLKNGTVRAQKFLVRIGETPGASG